MTPEAAAQLDLVDELSRRLEAFCGVRASKRERERIAALARAGELTGSPDGYRSLELGRLAETLTVGETHLFRHRDHYDALRELAWERASQGLGTRVLCAGVSTGEEAWSAAAVLADVYAGRADFEVTGWELSESRLATARAGRYGSWSAREGLCGYQRHFERAPDGSIGVGEHLRAAVRFERVNLLRVAPAPPCYDAVFFRNVSIYWSSATTRAVLASLLSRVHDHGLWLPGPSDPVTPEPPWRMELRGSAPIYRRAPEPPAPLLVAHSHAPAPPEPRPGDDAPAVAEASPPRHEPQEDWRAELRALADADRCQEALALWTRRADPLAPEDLVWRGILSLGLQRPAEAVDAFRRCVYLAPEVPRYRRWLEVAEVAAQRALVDPR